MSSEEAVIVLGNVLEHLTENGLRSKILKMCKFDPAGSSKRFDPQLRRMILKEQKLLEKDLKRQKEVEEKATMRLSKEKQCSRVETNAANQTDCHGQDLPLDSENGIWHRKSNDETDDKSNTEHKSKAKKKDKITLNISIGHTSWEEERKRREEEEAALEQEERRKARELHKRLEEDERIRKELQRQEEASRRKAELAAAVALSSPASDDAGVWSKAESRHKKRAASKLQPLFPDTGLLPSPIAPPNPALAPAPTPAVAPSIPLASPPPRASPQAHHPYPSDPALATSPPTPTTDQPYKAPAPYVPLQNMPEYTLFPTSTPSFHHKPTPPVSRVIEPPRHSMASTHMQCSPTTRLFALPTVCDILTVMPRHLTGPWDYCQATWSTSLSDRCSPSLSVSPSPTDSSVTGMFASPSGEYSCSPCSPSPVHDDPLFPPDFSSELEYLTQLCLGPSFALQN